MIVQRRCLLAPAWCALALAALSPAAAAAEPPRSHVAPLTVSPDEALAFLTEGNGRFVSGKSMHPRQTARRLVETSETQHPFATVLSCSDSRVPPEMLFDEGIGDIFSVRVAGNVADTDEMGSVEYGVGHLGTPLLIVMGHTKCGAVNAVASRTSVHGHIAELVDNIGPVVDEARRRLPQASQADLVTEAVRGNVLHAMATLLRESEGVRARVKNGQARAIGAIYDIRTGRVEWLGRHPDEALLLATSPAGARGQGMPAAAASNETTHAAPPTPLPSSGPPVGPTAAEHGQRPAENPLRSAPASLAVVALLCTMAGTISGRLSAPRPSSEAP